MKLPTQTQSFNDGIVNIYSVKNTADAGNMPKKNGLTLKVGSLRFEERVVGMGRYWSALQEQSRIEQILRVPRINSVNVHDVAILNGQQYDIMQVQYPPDVEPPCMDLSLERLEVAYEVN